MFETTAGALVRAEHEESAGAELVLVTFHVRERLCALDASGVQEVIRLAASTPLHRAAEDVIGLINLRGKIVTVLDLARRLGLGPYEASGENRIFIVEDRGEQVGLLVDRVGEVVETERDLLKRAPANVPWGQARYFQGVLKSGDRLIAVLDSSQVLSEEG